MTPPHRYVGIDFSAASKDGGRKTWIAEGTADDSGLTILRLFPAASLPNSGPDRDTMLPALRRYITETRNSLIGLDFPFSLPVALMDGDDWPSFAAHLGARFADPEAFRDWCRHRSNGREWRRRCDIEARTPFAAYNLRIYRQTYWGIVGILAPLAAGRRVAIAPVDCPRRTADATDTSTLAEICPASTLKRLDCYGSYKGTKNEHARARHAIVQRLVREGCRISPSMSAMAVENRGGDALDALAGCFTAWRIRRDGVALTPRDEIDRIEARVFV